MKITYFKFNFTVVIIILISLFFIRFSYSQNISSIKFSPPQPDPGSTLKLRINYSNLEDLPDEITIRLFTWKDSNNDCIYTDEEEQQKIIIFNKSEFVEQINDNEIVVDIYEVPANNPPFKYLAMVGSNTESIIVESTCKTDEDSSIWERAKNVASLPLQVAMRLTRMNDVLRSNDQENLNGDLKLFIYDRNNQSIEKVAFETGSDIYSPNWSSNSKNLTFKIVNDRSKVAWTNIENKDLNKITTGPNDIDPFWMPNNRNVLFIRDKKFHLVDTENSNIQPLDLEEVVERILYVSEGPENTVQIIYKGPNQHTTQTKEIYLLSLDKELRKKDRQHLVNNPSWYLLTAANPSGNHLVYTQQIDDINQLSIRDINTGNSELLFEDNHDSFEPSWSPDGNKIAFVSDRQE